MQRLLMIVVLGFQFSVIGQTTTIFSTGSNWKYNDSGADLGTTWRMASYSDNAWTSGNAELGYGDGDEQTTVSYGPDGNNKYITTYFRKTFYVADPALFSQMAGTIKRDDGAVVYINGIEVFRSNMPGGNPQFQTLANGTVAWPNEDDFQNFSFSPGLLVAGNNLIAVEIHQDDNSSSDISFDCSLSGDEAAQNIVIDRGPYLQQATPTSVIIRWRTDVPTESYVKFGTNAAAQNQQVQQLQLTTEHEVTIQNLYPATTYYYTIGNAATWLTTSSPAIYFRTNPVPGNPGEYRFWVIGDAGMGNDDQRNVRDGFMAVNQGTHIDGWIMLGDNAYGSGINDGTQENYQEGVFENMYEPILQNTVLWPATGNHDYNNHIPFSPAPAYFDIFSLPMYGEAGGLPSMSEKYYSYNYGNIHFIVLDSYDEDRDATAPMATWLVNDLQQNNAEWTIAYWHHPPYTKGSHNSDNGNFLDGELVEIRENIIPILEQYGVDLILNGHSHSYERSYLIDGHYGYSSDLDSSMILDNGTGGNDGDCPYQKHTVISKSHKGTVYAVVGCSGKLSGTSSDWPHPVMAEADNTKLGSMLFSVNHNRLDASFIETDGSIFDHFTILKNAGDNDTITVCPNDEVTFHPSFGGPATWSPLNIVSDSLTITPQFATMYFATDSTGCITDTFFVEMYPPSVCNLSATELTVDKPFISVEPEENNGALPIHWFGFDDNKLTLVVYSVFGQLITKEVLFNQPGEYNHWEIPTTSLAHGSYFIQLSGLNNRAFIQFTHH
ncbi:MAG TPA: metallophosphoesterase family protein [Fluviicola sp.]|nr:metallophosphoesterase family protein [Fluviicola sp.]